MRSGTVNWQFSVDFNIVIMYAICAAMITDSIGKGI